MTIPRDTRRHPVRAAAGFTILEVLVAVLVMAIGIVGILGMQTVAVQSNRVSYDARMATELAETTLERLKRDALEWTTSGLWPANTSLAWGMNAPGTWRLPPATDGPGGGATPTWNDMGIANVLDSRIGTGMERFAERNTRYCVQYRMDWVRNPSLVRAYVRVLWPRNATGEAAVAGDCSRLAALSQAEVNAAMWSVQVTGIVTQNQIAEE